MRTLTKNIIFLILFILLVLFFFPTENYADTIDDTFKGADEFVNKGDLSTINTQELKNTSDFIYNALLAVGMIGAVIVGIILGIKYMMANSEDKAVLKETLTPYIISCCVIFGAFAIWKLVINILQ